MRIRPKRFRKGVQPPTDSPDVRPEMVGSWPQRRFRLSIAMVLAVGFSVLTLVSAATVWAIGIGSAGRNTVELLTTLAAVSLENLAERTRQQLAPVESQADFVAELIASRAITTDDQDRLIDTLRGSLAATPQVTGVIFIDAEFNAIQVGQMDGHVSAGTGLTDAPPGVLQEAFDRSFERGQPYWADAVLSPALGQSLITLRYPVSQPDGSPAGLLIIAVSLQNLSDFLANAPTPGNAYILYDRDYVIAHRDMAGVQMGQENRPDEPALPRAEDFDDPVLAGLRGGEDISEDFVNSLQIAGDAPLSIRTNDLPPDDTNYVYLITSLDEFGARPWELVIALPGDVVDEPLERLVKAAGSSAIVIIVSVAVAFSAGKRLAGRIRTMADAARHLQALDFAGVPPLPDSRLRELAQAASAFNTMVTGLRWFETYVPKQLVLRLMREGRYGRMLSEERLVTVLFTDICGFSRLSQDMSAGQTAELLNGHFDLLSRCIEAQGGTVDKYIGDGIMAFWGAPETQENHAERAVRAALAIGRAVSEDNRKRQTDGAPRVRVRLALHTGTVVVGNIGSASRINYTVVGDTVNVASRLDDLGRERTTESTDWIVLASASTWSEVPDGVAQGTAVGAVELRGRSGYVDVIQITDLPEPA